MKRSIFWRNFLTNILLILLTFFLFGITAMALVSGYAKEEMGSILENQSARTAEAVALLNDNYSTPLERIVLNNINITAQDNNTNILVTDVEGTIVYATDTFARNNQIFSVGADVLKKTLSGGYREQSNLGGIYSARVITVGTPIVQSSGNISGFVFVSSMSPYIETMRSELSKILLNSAALVLVVAFVVCYFTSLRLTQPLKKMAQAASEYAKGNFEERLNLEGEDEIAELSLALDNMARSLSQFENMRSSFVANVSHELKTPMTTISGFIDGILDGTIPPEKHDYYLKIVSDEVKRLSRLVKSFLDLTRFETGTVILNKTKFDICEMMSTVLIGFEQMINQKNIYVEVYYQEPQILVSADYDMIFQVVYNLVENAVKFCPEGGVITMRAELEKKKVRCSVKNTGEGISAKDINMIFERFYKTDKSRSMDKKGVGLGLYMVRSILVAHGEPIDVDSVEGQYCEFSFTLPAEKNNEKN